MKLPLGILALTALSGCAQVDQDHLRLASKHCGGQENVGYVRADTFSLIVKCATGDVQRLD